jgi:hypothetical protein
MYSICYPTGEIEYPTLSNGESEGQLKMSVAAATLQDTEQKSKNAAGISLRPQKVRKK